MMSFRQSSEAKRQKVYLGGHSSNTADGRQTSGNINCAIKKVCGVHSGAEYGAIC